MKKTLLVAALATLTTGAFAGSAMDLNIPDSSKPASSQGSGSATPAQVQPVAMRAASTPAKPVTAVQPTASQVAASRPAATVHPTPAQPARPADRPASNAAAPVVAASAASSAVPASEALTGDIPNLDPTTGKAVNPFTGKSLNEEDLQRQLEASKARTALLEEQLKQATITADIANVPIKKRAEVAKLDLPPAPAPASAVAVPKVVKHVKKQPVKKTPAVEVVAPKMPNVRLDGIVVNQGVASAILDVDGNSSVVANGASTPFGPVRVLTATSAMVGGMALHVSEDSTIARVHISDPKPVDPKEKTAGLPTLAIPGATGAATTSAGRPLPPVPLPPPTTAATAVVH